MNTWISITFMLIFKWNDTNYTVRTTWVRVSMLPNSHHSHITILMESMGLLWKHVIKLLHIGVINQILWHAYENHMNCLMKSLYFRNTIIWIFHTTMNYFSITITKPIQKQPLTTWTNILFLTCVCCCVCLKVEQLFNPIPITSFLKWWTLSLKRQ